MVNILKSFNETCFLEYWMLEKTLNNELKYLLLVMFNTSEHVTLLFMLNVSAHVNK